MSEDATFDLSTDVNTSDGIQIKGQVPKGTLKVNKKGETALAIENGRYCIIKNYSDKDVTVIEGAENCRLPEEQKKLVDVVVSMPNNGDESGESGSTGEVGIASCVTDETTCEPGTALAIQVNTSDTYVFRVLNDDGKKVTLIMNDDLGESVDWHDAYYCEVFEYDGNGNGVIEEEEGEREEMCNGTNVYGPLTALEKLKERTQNWTNITEDSYELNYGNVFFPFHDGEFFVGKYSGEYVQNVRARLPKYSDISLFDEDSSEGISLPIWLFDNVGREGWYWLSDADSSYALGANALHGHCEESGCNIDIWGLDASESHGLRPVITIAK